MEAVALSGLTASLVPVFYGIKNAIPDSISIETQTEYGPVGDIGSNGPTGPVGLSGAAGPQGPYGMKGLPGPTGPSTIGGPTGAAGLLGPTGPIGPTGATPSNGTNPAHTSNVHLSAGNLTFTNDVSQNYTFSVTPSQVYLITGAYTVSSLSAFPAGAVLETRIIDSVDTAETWSLVPLPSGKTTASASFSEIVTARGGTLTFKSQGYINGTTSTTGPDGTLTLATGTLTTISAMRLGAPLA
jgi:hypothetical protein